MSAESPRNDVPMVLMHGGEITVVSGVWGDDKYENQELEIGLILIELARKMPDYGEEDLAETFGDGKSH